MSATYFAINYSAKLEKCAALCDNNAGDHKATIHKPTQLQINMIKPPCRLLAAASQVHKKVNLRSSSRTDGDDDNSDNEQQLYLELLPFNVEVRAYL